MRKEPKEKTFDEVVTPVIIWAIIAVASFYIGRYSMKDSFNPRVTNSDTTLYYLDTAYVTRIIIDSSYEVKDDSHEPAEAPIKKNQ